MCSLENISLWLPLTIKDGESNFRLSLSSLLFCRKNVYDVLHETLEHRDPWAGGRYLISLVWDAHGYIWHGK